MFDYIVIGAGSAGCVLAARLSEDPSNKVLLLEAGPNDKHPMIHMPGGAAEVLKSKTLNWQNYSVPQKNLNNRRLYVPRGKMLGGSSSINGMVYIRGHASDYDDWAEAGNTGWAYKDVLPYFKKSENNVRGANDFHGVGGGLNVIDAPSQNILFDRFIEAGVELGHPRCDDFNGADQEGFGRFQATIRNGRRCSSAVAFLTPQVRKRPNLTILPGAHVKQIIINTDKVIGVEYLQGRKLERAMVSKEVVVSAGAIKSPQILQLSGVGHAEDLKKAGVVLKVELPGVGRNLQEHLDVVLNYTCTQPITLNGPATKLHLQAKTAMDYFLFNKGIATCNQIEGGAFVKSSPELSRPDIQMHFVPVLMTGLIDPVPKQDGVTVHACKLRPESSGTIMITSSDPKDEPLIDFNFCSTEGDWQTLIKCYELCRDLMAAKAWGDLIGGSWRPDHELHKEEDIREFIRNHADTVYHPVGTCKMGSGEDAVVDHELKVRGVQGLRVADASIIPKLIGGNTNAPAIMIGEKCADMMLNH
ncbi:MAG: choline dehydrogenase [Pseudomonadales bacterium]|nr:choline dehydrogenase [Pseudomonadales bacterium]